MCDDLRHCADLGYQGVAIGALTPEGDVDSAAMQRFMRVARGVSPPLAVTFHRAFDLVRDPWETLDIIIGLGCSRVLSSGLANRCSEGLSLLIELVAVAQDRIQILPGGGISEKNIGEIAAKTCLFEFHASARVPRASAMTWMRSEVAMGSTAGDAYEEDFVASAERVRALREAADSALSKSDMTADL